MCHTPRRRSWGYRPLSLYDLLPGLGYEPRDWLPEELPDYVTLCGVCDGKGVYEQTYTAGCGMGSYRSSGKCGYCGGVGLRYQFAETGYGRDNPIPISVIVQILTTRERAATVVESSREVEVA